MINVAKASDLEFNGGSKENCEGCHGALVLASVTGGEMEQLNSTKCGLVPFLRKTRSGANIMVEPCSLEVVGAEK